MKVLEGKVVAQMVYDKIKESPNSNRCKTLAIITVGEDEASKVYVNTKKKKAKECGFNSMHIQLSEDTPFYHLESVIENLNRLDYIGGIIVQKPLPKGLSLFDDKIDSLIDPRKDIDGFHPNSKFIACTPKGIITLMDSYNVPYQGKNVVIAGRSKIVAQPLAKLLMDRNCTVTMIHSKTDKNTVARLIDDCDIFISAIGRPKYWTEEHLGHGKDKIALIDVGINRDENGKLCGDVDPNAYKHFEYYTPVPGGVGVMTVASLLENLHLAKGRLKCQTK